MVPGLIYARREASLMTAVIYTQDTETWCDPCAMARDECGHDTPDSRLYANIRAWRTGDVRKVVPTIMRRIDDAHVFYPGRLNVLIGDPESAKTWVALAAVAVVLRRGGRALYVDADHNGIDGIVPRLDILGAPAEALESLDQFRYAEVDSAEEYAQVVSSAQQWKPTITILDAHASIADMHGLNDNDGGEMRRFHRTLTYPFTIGGGAVILIDHMAKNETSRAFGGTGATAKNAAVNGVMYRVDVLDAWAEPTGGSVKLYVVKDRPAGVRSHCAPVKGREKPFFGVFRLHPPRDGETEQAWAIYPPDRDGETPELSDLVSRIEHLSDADRSTVRAVKDALNVRTDKAGEALKVWRAQQGTRGTDPSDPALITV